MPDSQRKLRDRDLALAFAMVVGLAFPAIYHQWVVSIAIAAVAGVLTYAIIRLVQRRRKGSSTHEAE